MSDTLASNTTAGPGFGNKTSSNGTADASYDNSTLRTGTSHDASAYSGSTSYGSGTTGGAGFGNKTGSFSGSDANDSNLRTGTTHDTKPYSGHTDYGSGTTGGAGFGNKTGSFSNGSGETSEGKNDSTIGKILQKTGTALHSTTLEQKGQAKREAASSSPTSSHHGHNDPSVPETYAQTDADADRLCGSNDDISKVTTASSDALGREAGFGGGRDSEDSGKTAPYSAGAGKGNSYGKTDADQDRLVDETAAAAVPVMSGARDGGGN